VSEEPAPERIALIWSPEARVDVRMIERDNAMQILHYRFLTNRVGDVKKLKPPRTGFRLQCGDTGCSSISGEATIEITGVKNRREAYR
jgi:hypothetical protein